MTEQELYDHWKKAITEKYKAQRDSKEISIISDMMHDLLLETGKTVRQDRNKGGIAYDSSYRKNGAISTADRRFSLQTVWRMLNWKQKTLD